jgi:hypothetical protein
MTAATRNAGTTSSRPAAAGYVIAARLSEDGTCRVLLHLLEAGTNHRA